MSPYIESLINDIEKYENKKELNNEPKDNEEIIVFIGKSKYPKKSATNVNPFGLYMKFNFTEVAFLCDRDTLELYSIIGILFDSMDDAAILIRQLLANGLMDSFAKYLLYEKHVFLVNLDKQILSINKLLQQYKKHKIFMCCGSGCSPMNFAALNKSKTNGKFNFVFKANHPSSKSYITGHINCCLTYLSRTYIDNMSNLSIQDFKVL